MPSGHSGHVFPFASCMASIHHLIGWHAWLLPSSPWQCECPPVSHHHGNGSVPQQPSAWAECKPLNQDHHGNVCLLEHRAVVCLWVRVRKRREIMLATSSGVGDGIFLSLLYTLYSVIVFVRRRFFFLPSRCILRQRSGCCDVASLLSGTWQEV